VHVKGSRVHGVAQRPRFAFLVGGQPPPSLFVMRGHKR
jgi:hypothetical protein